MRVVAVLVGVALAELAVLLWVAAWLGPWPVLAAIVLTGLLGAGILRRQGRAALAALAGLPARGGDNPLAQLADGSLLAIAGGMLLLPGLLGDAAGLALLVPPVRRAIVRSLPRATFAAAGAARPQGGHGNVIEGTYRVVGEADGPAPAPPATRPVRHPGDAPRH